ncbi:MAG: Bax inhibitor-1 family protein, partial [Bacteroidota bacterium]
MSQLRANSFSQAISADVIRTYVQRVYAWMVGGLLLTGATAFMVSGSEVLLAAIFGTPLKWVVLLAPSAMVWFLAARVDQMQPSTAAGLFIAYEIANVLAFAAIVLV